MEHTADIGLRVYGHDLAELFQNAALGLFDLIAGPDRMEGENNSEKHFFSIREENAGELFLKWLRELLFLFSVKRVIFDCFHFKKITETMLEAEVRGWKFDPRRHEGKYEVKAITRHAFNIQQTQDGWIAEVILDI